MKTYKIKHIFLRGEVVTEGTLLDLVKGYGYTLLSGHTHDARIPTNPKTIKALLNALNRSCQVTGRYNDYYYLLND